MMHSVDRQGVIQMANKAAHKILNYKNGELVGKTIFELYPHQMHKAVREGLDRILETGYHHLVETMMVTSQKELVKVEVVSTSIKDGAGVRSGTITIGRVNDPDAMVKTLQQVAGNWSSHYEDKA
jgi:PAS domain S-box-containing protein